MCKTMKSCKMYLAVVACLLMVLSVLPVGYVFAEMTPQEVTGTPDGTITAMLELPVMTSGFVDITEWVSSDPTILLVKNGYTAYPIVAKTDKAVTLTAKLSDGTEEAVQVTVPKKENWITIVDEDFESTTAMEESSSGDVGILPSNPNNGTWSKRTSDAKFMGVAQENILDGSGSPTGETNNYLSIKGMFTNADTLQAQLSFDTSAYDLVEVDFDVTNKGDTVALWFSAGNSFNNPTLLRTELYTEKFRTQGEIGSLGMGSVTDFIYEKKAAYQSIHMKFNQPSSGRGTFEVAVDGIAEPPALKNNKLWADGAKLQTIPFGAIRNQNCDLQIDNIQVRADTVVASAGNKYLDSISIPGLGSIESDTITLPLATPNGNKTIEWVSSDTATISSTGVVTRPEGADKDVTLYALIDIDGNYYAKAFEATVIGQGQDLTIGSITGNAEGMIHKALTLPSQTKDGEAITWTSSDLTGLLLDGVLAYPIKKDAEQKITLTANIAKADSSIEQKEFTVTVPDITDDFVTLVDQNFEGTASDGLPVNEGLGGNWTRGGVAQVHKRSVKIVEQPAEGDAPANKYITVDNSADTTKHPDDTISLALNLDTAAYDMIEVRFDAVVNQIESTDEKPASVVHSRPMGNTGAMYRSQFHSNLFWLQANENGPDGVSNINLTANEQNSWNTYRFLFNQPDEGRGTIDLSINGDKKELGTKNKLWTNANHLTVFSFFIGRNTFASMGIDNMVVRANPRKTLDAQTAALSVSGLDSVTDGISLPSSTEDGTDVVWVSSKPEYINSFGDVVSRPAANTKDETVTLYAVVIDADGRIAVKSFNAVVKQQEDNLVTFDTQTDGSITATYNFKKNAGQEVTVYLAAYDGSRLVAAAAKDYTVAGTGSLASTDLTLTAEKYTAVKGFIWEKGTMKPICVNAKQQ